MIHTEKFRKKILEEKERLSDKIKAYGFESIFTPTKTFSRLYEEIPEFNIGDYSLLNLRKDDEKVKELLKKVSNETKHLSTVGVEIVYEGSLDNLVVEEFNKAASIVFNEVPETYSGKNKSEIRTMPTNPYAFKWLIQELNAFFPKFAGTVQVSVGNVNEERMPYVFLTLYFMHPSCVFETKKATKEDMMGFPGAYIGQTIDKRGKIRNRGQTNYSIMHSYDSKEVINACLIAAKIHSLSKEEFWEYSRELRTILGIDHPILNLVYKEWPMKTHPYAAYQMPEDFIEKSIEKIKENWKIKELEQKIKELNEEDIQKIRTLNNKIARLVEKYTTEEIDLKYAGSLDELLRKTN
ncbi:hypothetical protein HZA97_04885 [Candidatus Woesearchaeota archaeon]|nr:hypothetical protein [Candidatus Woesearchaeota archaeon]